MAQRMFSRIDARVAVGLIIAALGVVLTALSFRSHQPWSVERFWPLLVVGFGASRFAERPGRLEGWVLLLVGGAVQISNLGLFTLPAREMVRYWPLAVVLGGLLEMMYSRSLGAIVEGFAIVLLGVWLQLSYFGVAHISSYRIWPLVLSVVGGVMVWRGLARKEVLHDADAEDEF